MSFKAWRASRRERRIDAYEEALMRATGGKGMLCSLGAPPPRTVQQIQAEGPGIPLVGADAYDFDD